MSESTYMVQGIHCQSCVSNISRGVSAVPGVTEVEVDLEGRVVVRGERFEDSAVRAAIEAMGYQAA